MFDYVILILCVYVAYSNFTKLFEVPFGEWELVQWLLLVVTLAIVVIALLRAWFIFKKEKAKRQESAEARQEGTQDARADAALDEEAGTEGPVVVTMEDLARLDEVDLAEDENE